MRKKKKRKKKPPKMRALRFQDAVAVLAGIVTIIWYILNLIERLT